MYGLRTFTRLAAILVVLALSASACGSSANDEGGGDARVDVDGVHSGCADLIEVGLLLAASDTNDLSPDDLARMNDGLSRGRDSFDDAPEAARRYLELLDDAVSKAREEVADRGQVNGDQIAMLLGVELLATDGELDRVGRESANYFETACDAAFSSRGGLISAGTESDGPIGSASELDPATSTTVTLAPPEAFVTVDEASIGAYGTFLLLELEVGEIVRTNVEPSEALVEGTDGVGTEDEYVLVELRVTSVGSSGSLRTSNFALVDTTGQSITAVSMLDATGHDMRPAVSQNESVNGYLAFPGSVGDLDGAVLAVSGGDEEPENIPLGVGNETSPYPVALATGEAGAGIYETDATVCIYPIETEVRGAVVSLDGIDRNSVLRASTGRRFLTLEVAVDVLSVSGPSCEWATTIFYNLWEVRLRLDNGDVIAPYYFEGSAEVGATGMAEMTFSLPADSDSMEFVDGSGTVLASWTDLGLPDA